MGVFYACLGISASLSPYLFRMCASQGLLYSFIRKRFCIPALLYDDRFVGYSTLIYVQVLLHPYVHLGRPLHRVFYTCLRSSASLSPSLFMTSASLCLLCLFWYKHCFIPMLMQSKHFVGLSIIILAHILLYPTLFQNKRFLRSSTLFQGQELSFPYASLEQVLCGGIQSLFKDKYFSIIMLAQDKRFIASYVLIQTQLIL